MACGEVAESGWLRTTRNRVGVTPSWVRIPPSPFWVTDQGRFPLPWSTVLKKISSEAVCLFVLMCLDQTLTVKWEMNNVPNGCNHCCSNSQMCWSEMFDWMDINRVSAVCANTMTLLWRSSIAAIYTIRSLRIAVIVDVCILLLLRPVADSVI